MKLLFGMLPFIVASQWSPSNARCPSGHCTLRHNEIEHIHACVEKECLALFTTHENEKEFPSFINAFFPLGGFASFKRP